VQALRVALAEHWRLGDALGSHYPTMGEALEAARLVGLPQEFLQSAEEALGSGNWARHAGPPSAPARPPPMPLGTCAVLLETVLKVQSFPLNAGAEAFCCWAPGVWSVQADAGQAEQEDPEEEDVDADADAEEVQTVDGDTPFDQEGEANQEGAEQDGYGFEYEHDAEHSEQCEDDNEQFDKEQMSEEVSVSDTDDVDDTELGEAEADAAGRAASASAATACTTSSPSRGGGATAAAYLQDHPAALLRGGQGVSWGFVEVYEVECFKLYNRLARRGFFEDGEVDSEGDAAKDVKDDDDQHDSVGQDSVEKDEDVNGFEYEHVAERSEQCDDDNEQFDMEQMSEESFDGEAFLAKAFLQFGSGEGLQLEAIVRELDRVGLELEPMCAFMATGRFRELYHVDGETLFCVDSGE